MLDGFLAELEVDSDLFGRDGLRKRIDALDRLDFFLGSAGPRSSLGVQRAVTMRSRLDAANAAVYDAIREEIRQGSVADVWQWLRGQRETELPRHGLSYDSLDEIVSGLLQLHVPEMELPELAEEMVFYQPTPARHILDLIERFDLRETDRLVDFGAGMGHVSLLASMFSGCQSVGIEVQAAYVAAARQCAADLGLEQARFLEQDVREADLGWGTVFYLYTPFRGSMLAEVLQRLEEESRKRPIRIASLGPCTAEIAAQSWVKAVSAVDEGRLCLFEGR
ncbi:SAM-dependent methyltransferase [Terriglobus albidus]|uniref:SAM-dependent methyltransferase n=1 Tax=Terriglobus albidus TaxID=1592106 RepID=UPI0021E0C97E|nr:SAM-dependent methyltransferase [Terriglobus albidus]